jgi:hypothetical protein
MAITRTAMIDDDGSGTTGTIINNAWKQQFYDQIDAAVGAWVDVPYAASNFTSAAGTWTVDSGDQLTFGYARVGRLVTFMINLATTVLSGAPSLDLRIRLPLSTTRSTDVLFWGDQAGNIMMRVHVVSGDPTLYFYRIDGANWAVTTSIYLSGQITLMV